MLSKGLKFVPTPRRDLDEEVLTAYVDNFILKVKRQYFFNVKAKRGAAPSKTAPFRIQSDWEPPPDSIPEELDQHLEDLRSSLLALRRDQTDVINLPRGEYKALENLCQLQHELIIKKADKGSAVVLQDRDNYIKEGLRQLGNPEFYVPLEGPIYEETYHIFEEILLDLLDIPGEVGATDCPIISGISEKQYQRLLPRKVKLRERRFYMLPKIHKDPAKWSTPHVIPPGRPIVSDCSSEGYEIAAFIDYFLQPIATSHPAYLKDTNHFLERISQIPVKKDSILVTADVDAMYTNISHEAGIAAVKRALERHPPSEEHPRIPDTYLLQLLEISLTRNDFLFNGHFYLQVKGTAMGKKFAPSYANIFMADWEQRMLQEATLKPHNWDRFLDDIFMVWDHGEEALGEFFNYLNGDDPNVQLKQEADPQKVDFLDVTVYKGPRLDQGRLDTKLYRKPTDTLELLHMDSYHPKHTFRGIIKSQILRFHRLCTEETHFNEAFEQLVKALTPRGYTKTFLLDIKKDTLRELENPALKRRDPMRYLLQDPPVTLQSRSCGSGHCHACLHLETNTSFRSSVTEEIYPIQHQMDCNTKGVIYLVTCDKCNIQYVGETSGTIRQRLWRYRNRIDGQEYPPFPTLIEEHFRPENGHNGMGDFNVTLIGIHRTISGDRSYSAAGRQAVESFWINELQTMDPQGLNMKIQGKDQILPLIVPYRGITLDWARNTIRKWHWDVKPTVHPYLPNRVLAALTKAPNLTAFVSKAELKSTTAPRKNDEHPDNTYTAEDLAAILEQNEWQEQGILDDSTRDFLNSSDTPDLSQTVAILAELLEENPPETRDSSPSRDTGYDTHSSAEEADNNDG